MKLLGGNKSVPKENEGSMGRQFSDVESHDLVPIPELNVGHPVRACVLLQWGLDENDVKLVIETFQVERLQVTLEVHRRMSGVAHQVVLQLDQFAKFGILLKPRYGSLNYFK